jgi:hypothetical protein
VAYAQRAFADGAYAEALRAMEALDRPARDRVLYLLETGTIRHTQGDFRGSNRDFLEAAELMADFDRCAYLSLRDAAAFAGAIAVNDNLLPYRGAAHERILVHTYLALNFMLLRDMTGLRVEIQRAYARQQEARDEHAALIERTEDHAAEAGVRSEAVADVVAGAYADQRAILERAGNVYQNAFTYYVSSIAYELAGAIDDAYIDAKTVYRLNPGFRPVRRDLLRYARRLGLASDYARWRRLFGDEVDDAVPAGHGEIILLFECGRAPSLEEIKIAVPVPVDDGTNLVTVALPKFAPRPNPVDRAVVYVDGMRLAATTPLMSVEATAVRELWGRAVAIAARQVLRLAGRFAAIEAARREHPLLGALASLFAYVLEEADLRSWNSLPRDVQVARASVPAGRHAVAVDLEGGERLCVGELTFREGGKTILVLRSLGRRGTVHTVAY